MPSTRQLLSSMVPSKVYIRRLLVRLEEGEIRRLGEETCECTTPNGKENVGILTGSSSRLRFLIFLIFQNWIVELH
jgi:hypothetical protein